MPKKHSWSYILSLTLVLAIAFSGLAQAAAPDQVNEATVFFNHILQETSNPVIANLARQSLAKLQEGPRTENRRQVEVPLIPQMKNSLAVPMLIDKRVIATFVVDTGATYTVITPSLANRIGVVVTPQTPRMTIMTANGNIYAPVVTLNNVSIGGVEVNGVKAVVQDLGGDAMLSGLLGMNFFKNMDLTIKQNKLIISVSDAR